MIFRAPPGICYPAEVHRADSGHAPGVLNTKRQGYVDCTESDWLPHHGVSHGAMPPRGVSQPGDDALLR